MNVAKGWYDEKWKKESPVLYDCIMEGINYAYSRPELTPSEIRSSFDRQIELKQKYWKSRIEDKMNKGSVIKR